MSVSNWIDAQYERLMDIEHELKTASPEQAKILNAEAEQIHYDLRNFDLD
jgi:hypothetical protein